MIGVNRSSSFYMALSSVSRDDVLGCVPVRLNCSVDVNSAEGTFVLGSISSAWTARRLIVPVSS